jgi:hypothetical protein
MRATCTRGETTFHRNEDGSPYPETTCCACRRRFCADHKVVLDGVAYCLGCAVAEVESQEPECECQRTDVDLFDAAGCELHNPASPWNVRLRALTAIQQYEQQHQDQRREEYGLA